MDNTSQVYVFSTNRTEFYKKYQIEKGNAMSNMKYQKEESITINIDKKEYNEKPKGSCIGVISDNAVNNIEKITLSEFADRVGNRGTSFVKSLVENGRCKENFVSQKLLLLDFDQEENFVISYEEFCERCTLYNIPFILTYKTFSSDSRKKYFKFRAVFVMEILITNVEFANAVNILFQKLFPEADSACTDVTRLFFGGKKIIESNLEARVDIMNIFSNAIVHMELKCGKNFSRDVKKLAKKINVQWNKEEKCFGFYRKADLDIEEIQGKDYVEQDGIIMFRWSDDICDKVNKGDRENKGSKKIEGYTEEMLVEICPLLRAFVQGDELTHAEEFLLATNLGCIKGGKTIFFDALEIKDMPEYKKKKWRRDWEKDIVGKNYKPQECAKVCKYACDCNCYSLCQKLMQKIRRVGTKEEYFPLEVCEQDLELNLTKVIENPENAMHVLVAQTGLGKTEIYCRKVAEMPNKKFIIAVPTCKLQEEVVQRLEEKGVTCFATVSRINKIKKLGVNDLYNETCELYKHGFGIMIKATVEDYIERNKEYLSDYQKKELKEVIKRKKYPKERCIVTTHAFLMMMNLDDFSEYEIIIDEDILMTLFKRNGVISVQDIQQMLKVKNLKKEVQNELQKIVKMEDGESRRKESMHLDAKYKKCLYEQGIVFRNSFPLLLESTSVVMDKAENQVIFFNRKNLPDRKIIVVSASANRQLYKKYFFDRTVYFYTIHKAQYVGEVKQYTAHTMSRCFMETVGIDTVFNKVQEITGDIPVISFKMVNKSDIYFGKTEGFDEFCGKDIAVVGTPHNKPLFYWLLGRELGYVKNRKDKCTLSNQWVIRNGYEFKIMTFSDENMQNLQLFFIETDLEQAIGRSRVLRNSCTVYVFSNYPCEQAELIQEKYLNVADNEEEEMPAELVEVV